MEQVLLKLARQLDSLDEASLLALWEDYAQRVSKFEPTKRWEEAVLVLSLIQVKHWKNQLFNQQFSAHVRPEFQVKGAERPFDFSLEKPQAPPHKAVILQFRPRQAASPEQTQPTADTTDASTDTDHTPDQN